MTGQPSTPAKPQEQEEHFAFGANWRDFIEHLDEERLQVARDSLCKMLGRDSLEELRFLDLGCGSGLFSLSASNLGADVVSIDYDPDSVACALELRRRYGIDPARWRIEQGDATDREQLDALETFDIVYSWGVLHHTGNLWRALDNAASAVGGDGQLFISLYNDQGFRSKIWTIVKRIYQRVPAGSRSTYAALVMLPRELMSLGYAIASGKPGRYVRSWTEYRQDRGMSRWHDLIDWVGGWPFEVSRPDEVFEFCRARGFALESLTTAGGGLGCNEFVFRREATPN